MRQAARVIAIDRRAIGGSIVDSNARDLGEELVLARRVLGEREILVQIRRAQIVEAETVPRLEIGMTPARVVRAADNQRDENEDDSEDGTKRPSA